MGRLIAIVVLAAATAACSSDDGNKMVGPSPTAPPTTAVETIGTVSQYASAFASIERDVRDRLATVDEECFLDTCSTIGSIAVSTLGMTSETLSLTLQLVQRPESGPTVFDAEKVPDEIRRLVEDTIAAAEAVASAATAAEDCARVGCENGELFGLQMDIGRLESRLDAWTPYL